MVHLTIYGVLGWLTTRAWANASRFPAAAIAAIVVISCFGALDEWHQQFIPRRSMELLDWAAFRLRLATEGDAWSPWCREQAGLIEAAGLAPAA